MKTIHLHVVHDRWVELRSESGKFLLIVESGGVMFRRWSRNLMKLSQDFVHVVGIDFDDIHGFFNTERKEVKKND